MKTPPSIPIPYLQWRIAALIIFNRTAQDVVSELGFFTVVSEWTWPFGTGRCCHGKEDLEVYSSGHNSPMCCHLSGAEAAASASSRNDIYGNKKATLGTAVKYASVRARNHFSARKIWFSGEFFPSPAAQYGKKHNLKQGYPPGVSDHKPIHLKRTSPNSERLPSSLPFFFLFLLRLNQKKNSRSGS